MANDVNAIPTTNDVSVTGNEDTVIPVTITGDDTDGTVTHFKVTTLPSNGTLFSDAGLTQLVVVGDLIPATAEAVTLYFRPDTNWNSTYGGGNVTFNYVAVDNDSGEDATAATATITVSAVDDGAPIATNDSFVTNVGTPIIITKAQLLANDSLPDHADLTSVSIGGAEVVDNGNGTYTFTPTTVGIQSFTYTLTDDQGETSTATVSLTAYTAGTIIENVYEAGLSDGTLAGDLSVPISETGSFGGALTSGVSYNGGTTITDGGAGDTNATAGIIGINTLYGRFDVMTATGAYSYTLNQSVDNISAATSSQDEVFTTTGGSGGLTLNVVIHDDAPTAQNNTIEIPQNTLPKYTLVLVLDTSASMIANITGDTTTRLDVAKVALASLIAEYTSQAADIQIKFITFNANATLQGTYTTKDAAINAVMNYNTTAIGTNYDNALNLVKGNTVFGTSLDTSRENIVYFVSDGVPQSGGTTPTDINTNTGYATYANTNNILTYGIGIGTGIYNTDPLNYIHNVNPLTGEVVATPLPYVSTTDITKAIIVPDLTNLESSLLATVPNTVGGNITESSSQGAQAKFGADDGDVSTITLLLNHDLNSGTAEQLLHSSIILQVIKSFW